MSYKTLLLLGGSGFLGSKLLGAFPSDKVIAPGHKQLDITQIKKVYAFIETIQPAVILYAAGITSIDFAEANEERTYLLNYRIPEKISKFAARNNIRFVSISTDAVFDEYMNKDQFSETDTPKARTVYGLSKLAGEEAVLGNSSQNCVLRLITLFGTGHPKPNFVALMKEKFSGVIDQIRNPLYVAIAAEAITFAVKQQLHGIYHLGALDADTNYNFLVKVAKRFMLDSSLIEKITYNDFMKDKRGYRKKNSVLVCNKFVQVSNNSILRTIEDSIELLYRHTNQQFS